MKVNGGYKVMIKAYSNEDRWSDAGELEIELSWNSSSCQLGIANI